MIKYFAGAIGVVLLYMSAGAQVPAPSVPEPTWADSVVTEPDSLRSRERPESVRNRPEQIKVVKRTFKYKRQIGLALGMMAFVALMMTSAQTWNPE